MGKGDKKTKRGKIIMGSYGVRRPSKFALRAKREVATQAATEEKKKK